MRRLILSLFTGCLFVLNACASGDQPAPSSSENPNQNLRLIVGFSDQQQHDSALADKEATLQQWQTASGASRLDYLRTLTGKAWVITVEGADASTVINSLQTLDGIDYVEEDQVIRISPIENRPAAPARIY